MWVFKQTISIIESGKSWAEAKEKLIFKGSRCSIRGHTVVGVLHRCDVPSPTMLSSRERIPIWPQLFLWFLRSSSPFSCPQVPSGYMLSWEFPFLFFKPRFAVSRHNLADAPCPHAHGPCRALSWTTANLLFKCEFSKIHFPTTEYNYLGRLWTNKCENKNCDTVPSSAYNVNFR